MKPQEFPGPLEGTSGPWRGHMKSGPSLMADDFTLWQQGNRVYGFHFMMQLTAPFLFFTRRDPMSRMNENDIVWEIVLLPGF